MREVRMEKKRILLVDDDPAYAKMVREWIKDIYRTDVVTQGEQAVKFLSKNAVDLVLLDYDMPGMDGPEVLQKIRKDPAISNIPIVFLTGMGSREGISKVLDLRPDGFLLKTSTKEDILNFLNERLK
jgi:CheY-like chemotaxis protein